MKKLSLEMLTSDEVIQKSQMKKITVGYGTYIYSYCTRGSVGAWGGYYSNGQAVSNAVAMYCAIGTAYCN